MRALAALLKKECLLLLRDWHALLLLFVMPAAFILIMSLALQDRFQAHGKVSASYYLVLQDDSALAHSVADKLAANPLFQHLDGSGVSQAALEARVQSDAAQFVVIIPLGFAAAADGKNPQAMTLGIGPGVEPALRELFSAALREALSLAQMQASLADLKKQLGPYAKKDALAKLELKNTDALIQRKALYQQNGAAELPSSVQQNVPAWLVFAMFFIAIPLSTTWVQERQQGSMLRLRSMGVKPWLLLGGKLLPYIGVNLVQVVAMLAIGHWGVPFFGGEQLALGSAPAALALMALAISFASVSYALLIANLVSTSEQATIFTGVSNLLLAALGGIMVPRFVMPLAMQAVSLYSPLAWGLEGFLHVFLRQGGLRAVAPEAFKLFCFGAGALGLAVLRLGRWRRD